MTGERPGVWVPVNDGRSRERCAPAPMPPMEWAMDPDSDGGCPESEWTPMVLRLCEQRHLWPYPWPDTMYRCVIEFITDEVKPCPTP
jgi:hypothetical protein